MAKKEAEKKEDEGEESSMSMVVLRAGLHCEGCADKVRRSIKHLDGVESVKVDYETRKITVVGKLDPAKVKEKVEEKTKKTAHLLLPKPPKKVKGGGVEGSSDKNSDENPPEKKSVDDINKADGEKPKEDVVNSVVLKTRVHCDSCARKINKIIKKCEGVEGVNVDLEKDTVIVKGTMDIKAMLPNLNTKLKRKVEIVAPPSSKDGDSINEKPKGGVDKKGKKAAKLPSGGCVGGEEEKKEETKPTTSEGSNKQPLADENTRKIEVVNKMEHNRTNLNEYEAHTYDPQQEHGKGYVVEYWNGPDYYYNMHAPKNSGAPPPQPYYLDVPQMFSDENPNACSVM